MGSSLNLATYFQGVEIMKLCVEEKKRINYYTEGGRDGEGKSLREMRDLPAEVPA